MTGGVTGSEQAPHIDGVELRNRHSTWSDTIYRSSCHFMCTFSSWALVILSVRPPIRSSPPYTLSPGTSFSRASFPRAWSLRGQSMVSLADIYRWRSDFILFLKKCHQWWCVVRTAVRDKPSLFTISRSCKKKKGYSKLWENISEIQNIVIWKLITSLKLIPGSKMHIFQK